MASMLAPQLAFRALRTAPRAAPWARLSALPRAQPVLRRFLAASAQEQPRLRLGSTGILESALIFGQRMLIAYISPQLQGIDHQGRD